VLLLGSKLWSDIMLDGIGFLLVMVSLLCFLTSVIASLVWCATERSKSSLYRIALNAVFFALFFPTGYLGGYLREQLFRVHLSRFQQVTDFLINNVKGKLNAEVAWTRASLPPGYSDLHVADYVLIDSDHGSITVIYTSRDSSALGHRGYLYRSDDDPGPLKKTFSYLQYKRLAPHWFFYVD